MENKQAMQLEDVKVEIKKEGNLTILNITGECEINMNGSNIYSPQNKKEYRYLPENLIPFIDKYIEYIDYDGENVNIDLCIDGKTITIYVPKNKNKKTFVARYDTSDPELLQDYTLTESQIQKYNESYTSMNEKLSELGYKLKQSHSQGEFIWCWSDLTFHIKTFNEEEFIKVSQIILEHYKVTTELYDELY